MGFKWEQQMSVSRKLHVVGQVEHCAFQRVLFTSLWI